ncbi:MAG: PBSX family phage terminase large subunit, partial [Clostridiaceae bacterium]|nr:PBSX family phage terminase large subunit [Clostridiaceae bacterium]
METQLTTKQAAIVKNYLRNKPRILVLYGAVRSGKTFLAVFLFLMCVRAHINENLKFIIGGVSQTTIAMNVLSMIEEMLNIEIRLDKYNRFEMYGNQIICYGGSDASSWKAVRGFTANGALMNEATALHDTFVKEVITRCSGEDSRIIMDTNPDNPSHPVKKHYIDNNGQKLANGRVNIEAHHFTIFDNEVLNHEYIESMIMTTPTGMFTDRNIYGKWVSAEGAIYQDFNNDNFISQAQIDKTEFIRVFAGVDWGYAHKGVMVVWGVDSHGVRYRIEEFVYRHKDVDAFWVDVALSIKNKYGSIPFYCDPARPEYIAKLLKKGINAHRAQNLVMHGISIMGTLYKSNKALVNRDSCEGFLEEIYSYQYA